MDKELKSEFDYVILGTNFENSVLAGALSRIGKRVVLIDRNNYYGSNNATFCFTELQDFGNTKGCTKQPDSITTLPIPSVLKDLNDPIIRRTLIFKGDEIEVKEEDPITPTPLEEKDIRLINTLQSWNHPSILYWTETIGEKDNESFISKLKQQNRKYNIDLSSSMILSGGDIVDILASSGLGEYCHFYPMNAISALIQKEDQLQLVKLPCSRQEIFNNKSISLKEKRLLTKFIQYIIDHSAESIDEAKEMNDIELKQGRSLTRPQNKSVMVIDLNQYTNTPFVDFLEKEFHITGLLKDMIIYSICLTGSTESILTDSLDNPFTTLNTMEGLQRVEEFVKSLNIYGTTPFLYPIYGEGDILQSFCRINNVYGGITMLQTEVTRVIVKEETEEVIGVEVFNDSTHQVIRCKNIIASDDYALTKEHSSGKACHIAHGVYVIEGDNKKEEKQEEVNELIPEQNILKKELRDIVVLPATENHRAIYLLIFNSEFRLTAPDELLIHAFIECEDISEESSASIYSLLDQAVHLYSSQLPSTVPISFLYTCHYVECFYQHEEKLKNYYYLPTRQESCYLYMDHRMKRVHDFFDMICPGCEFLPRTHSSQESSKEDVVSQELNYFDQLVDTMEKQEKEE